MIRFCPRHLFRFLWSYLAGLVRLPLVLGAVSRRLCSVEMDLESLTGAILRQRQQFATVQIWGFRQPFRVPPKLQAELGPEQSKKLLQVTGAPEEEPRALILVAGYRLAITPGETLRETFRPEAPVLAGFLIFVSGPAVLRECIVGNEYQSLTSTTSTDVFCSRTACEIGQAVRFAIEGT